MRKFLALGIVLSVLVAVDQGARVFAENKLEEKARAEVRGASSVDARISSFPFLGRLLASGSVSTVEVRAERAGLSDLLSAAVTVDMRGVLLDRDDLFSGEVRLKGLDAGTITIEIDAAGLGRVLKLPVEIAGGEVRLTLAGRTLAARPTMVAGALVLEVAGDRSRLTCQVDEVPPALRR